MNTYKKLDLRAKGWEDAEIRKAERILERAEVQDVFFARLVFWTALIVIIFANLVVSLILVPVLAFFEGWMFYTVLIVLALGVGFVYNFLITDVQHLERKHHLIAGILLPLIALVNLALVVLVSNRLVEESTLATVKHNPWMIGVVFAAAFILPSILDKVRMAWKEGRKKVLV